MQTMKIWKEKTRIHILLYGSSKQLRLRRCLLYDFVDYSGFWKGDWELGGPYSTVSGIHTTSRSLWDIRTRDRVRKTMASRPTFYRVVPKLLSGFMQKKSELNIPLVTNVHHEISEVAISELCWTNSVNAAISLGFCIQESLGLPWAFLGVPLTELGTRLTFLCDLCQNCASLMRICA